MSCYECAYSRPGLSIDECSGFYCTYYNCPLCAIAGLDPEIGDSCFQEDIEE